MPRVWDELTGDLFEQVIQTVTAAMDTAQRQADSARALGNQTEADTFEAEARDAAARLESLQTYQVEPRAYGEHWWH